MRRRRVPQSAGPTWRMFLAIGLTASGFVSMLAGMAIDEVDPAIAELFGGRPPATYASHVGEFWASYVAAWLLLNGAFLVFARALRAPRPDSVLFQLLGPLFVFVTGMALYAATEAWGFASALVGLGPGMLFAACMASRRSAKAPHPLVQASHE